MSYYALYFINEDTGVIMSQARMARDMQRAVKSFRQQLRRWGSIEPGTTYRLTAQDLQTNDIEVAREYVWGCDCKALESKLWTSPVRKAR